MFVKGWNCLLVCVLLVLGGCGDNTVETTKKDAEKAKVEAAQARAEAAQAKAAATQAEAAKDWWKNMSETTVAVSFMAAGLILIAGIHIGSRALAKYRKEHRIEK